MSSLSTRFPTYNWKHDTVLENGGGFLKNTSDSIKTLKDQWDQAQKSGFYSKESTLAAKRIKTFAIQSRQEMRRLEKAASQLFKTGSGDEKKQLKEIIVATQTGREFLTGFIENTRFPTDTNHTFHDLLQIGGNVMGIVSLAAFTSIGLRTFDVIESNTMLRVFDVGSALFVASVAFKVLSAAKARFIDAPREHKVNSLQQIFDQTIALA